MSANLKYTTLFYSCFVFWVQKSQKIDQSAKMSGIDQSKLGCVVRIVVDSILPMQNAGQMTIGKTHPRLLECHKIHPSAKMSENSHDVSLPKWVISNDWRKFRISKMWKADRNQSVRFFLTSLKFLSIIFWHFLCHHINFEIFELEFSQFLTFSYSRNKKTRLFEKNLTFLLMTRDNPLFLER